MVEVDDNVKCLFKVGQNKNANISCDLNLENHKDIQTFTFKTSTILIGDYEIHLGKIENIELLHIEEEIPNNDYTTDFNNKDNVVNSDKINNDFKKDNSENINTDNNDKNNDNNKDDDKENYDNKNENNEDKNKDNNDNKEKENNNDKYNNDKETEIDIKYNNANDDNKESNSEHDNENNSIKNGYSKVSLKLLLAMIIIIIIIFLIIFFCKLKKICKKTQNEQKPYVNTTDENYGKYNSDMSDQRMKKQKNKNHKVINN